jgi:alpha-mannosidase
MKIDFHLQKQKDRAWEELFMKRCANKVSSVSRRQFLATAVASPLLGLAGSGNALKGRRVYVVPNFHPASCGWLTNFSTERVYCANSYFDHLDRVRDDPQYAFVLSEVNNLIAMMNFKPERMAELKKRLQEERVELVNGFFLESTINLSGGEALVRLGVEGIRWQRKMFGVRPRFAWTIDVCGTHDQMAQISAGLGLEAMVYTRKNPTGSAVHWSVSPDGTRVLSLSPGHYSELVTVMTTKEPLTAAQTAEVEKEISSKLKITPDGAPILILAGSGDYTLAPHRKEFPREFLEQWKQDPNHPEIRFSIMSKYLDELQGLEKAGKLKIPSMLGGTAYDFDSFWIESPRVKSAYRRCEHLLQAAESISVLGSLCGKQTYPSQELYNAWALLFLNTDRNTLWGSAGGMVFENPQSWDVKDRFDWIQQRSTSTAEAAGAALLPAGDGLGLYNPLNWTRQDPVILPQGLQGVRGQMVEGGGVLCEPELPPCSVGGWGKVAATSAEAKSILLPARIRTKHYDALIDPQSGAITGVMLHAYGKEMLAGPANVVVAEKPKSQNGDPGDFMLPRPGRQRLDTTSNHAQDIKVRQGPLATIVEVQGEFIGGGLCRRTMTFYTNYPRIDFTTELNDLPDLTVVVAEFPLAGEIVEIRRGIPYGFSHGAWNRDNPNLHGWTKGIVPAVRWSHYALAVGGGVALLDRGVTGRELNGNTPIIYLYNATDKYYGYPNPWLSGRGKHTLQYALVFHDGGWKQARIPQMAWEYNCPPVTLAGCGPHPTKSFLNTSDNVVVEAVRRMESDIEVRLVECLGYSGTAEITLLLPHKLARMTDLNGERPKALNGGPRYTFPVRPQQILTLRFATDEAVDEPELVTKWDAIVPPEKLAMLLQYSTQKGHPPKGN